MWRLYPTSRIRLALIAAGLVVSAIWAPWWVALPWCFALGWEGMATIHYYRRRRQMRSAVAGLEEAGWAITEALKNALRPAETRTRPAREIDLDVKREERP